MSVPSLRSYFDPFSKDHHAISDLRTMKAGTPIKIAVYLSSIALGIFTLGIGGMALFRCLVGRISKNVEGKTVKKTDRIAEEILVKKEPKKKYLFLKETDSSLYTFTPFEQGALALNLDPEWMGSCNILSHAWMYRKMQSEDFQQPLLYTITDSHLPHPLIVGDNAPEGADIVLIQETFTKSGYRTEYAEKHALEENTKKLNGAALAEYMTSRETHCMILNAHVFFNEFQGQFGHACAFAKRGDVCSWLDPNYGEVTFKNPEAFKAWFIKEVEEGVLKYFFNDTFNEAKKEFVSDIFPQPIFSEAEQQEHPLAEKMTKKRDAQGEERKTLKVKMIVNYALECYIPDSNTQPLPSMDDVAFL